MITIERESIDLIPGTEFSIGDRVISVEQGGQVGTILCYTVLHHNNVPELNQIGVVFDADVGGHSLTAINNIPAEARCEDGHGWYCYRSLLQRTK